MNVTRNVTDQAQSQGTKALMMISPRVDEEQRQQQRAKFAGKARRGRIDIGCCRCRSRTGATMFEFQGISMTLSRTGQRHF